MSRLALVVHLVDEWGEALEADLHRTFGLDLLDWFRGHHPWPKLGRLVNRLPAASHYRTALSTDRDIGAALLEEYGPDGPPEGDDHPPGEEYDPVVARLDLVFDRLGVMLAQIQHARRAPTPAPRPRTAYQQLVDEYEDRVLEALEAEVEAAIGRANARAAQST